MADQPVVSTILAQNGKYVILDVGDDKGVQVGDIFEDGDPIRFLHPRRSKKPEAEQWVEALGVMIEMYVEQVFEDYCLAVITYSDRMPYYDLNDIRAGKCKVRKGHEHRVTGQASLLNAQPARR